MLGIGLTTLGYGSFELFGGWTMYVFEGFVLLSVAGLFISYRQHKLIYPFLLSFAGALLIFVSYHFVDAGYWIYLMYTGMTLLTIVSLYNFYRTRMEKRKTGQLNLQSTITCPACGNPSVETMPENACQYFYVCPNCATRLQPKEGDCCVFCSYGSVVCPPMQSGIDCCA